MLFALASLLSLALCACAQDSTAVAADGPPADAGADAPAGADAAPDRGADDAAGADAAPDRSADDAEQAIGETRPLTLVIHDTSRLAIGRLPEFPYGGGSSPGTMTYTGGGKADVVIPAATMEVANLEIVKGVAFVQIVPKDMKGTIDFCSGIVGLAFDATFIPTVLGIANTPMSVVTQLTTETSTGAEKTLTGSRLGDDGELNLVGVAQVPKTGDAMVDGLLGLPADAATNMYGRIEFPAGRFPCPSW